MEAAAKLATEEWRGLAEWLVPLGLLVRGRTGGLPECEGPDDCADGEECAIDTCTGGTCEYTAVIAGTACNESNECTVGTCGSGACDSIPVGDGTTCGDGAGACCSGSCIPEILPALDGPNGIQARIFEESGCTARACHGSGDIPQTDLEPNSEFEVWP